PGKWWSGLEWRVVGDIFWSAWAGAWSCSCGSHGGGAPASAGQAGLAAPARPNTSAPVSAPRTFHLTICSSLGCGPVWAVGLVALRVRTEKDCAPHGHLSINGMVKGPDKRHG